jgi:hypothetical protein
MIRLTTYLKSWKVEVSKNGKEWFLIDEHWNDETIQESFKSYKFKCFTFQTCSFIRICSYFEDDFSLSFVDFFGKVFSLME